MTTITELDRDHIAIARPLFETATYDRVFADAFFEGVQPGRCFVDDPERPTAALLARTYEYFFAGEPDPAIRQFVLDAPQEANLFARYPSLEVARTGTMLGFYGLVGFTQAWTDTLRADHGGRLETIGRRAFTFPHEADAEARSMAARVPAGVTLVPLDAELAARTDVAVDEVIGLCWSGYARFGEHGFGIAALVGPEIASVAFAIAISAREANIGVGTAPAFQRQGLATLVSAACIGQALERGLRPTWDCDDSNPASGALALKLGFVEQPPFAELAFPGRAGPPRTTGLWSAEACAYGTRWQRNPHPLPPFPAAAGEGATSKAIH